MFCRGQLAAPALLSGAAGLRAARVGDERVLAPVEAGERADDRVFESVGVDALGASGSAVVSGAPVARVVPVDAGLAVGSGAQHGAAAGRASDQPGEQARAAVRCHRINLASVGLSQSIQG